MKKGRDMKIGVKGVKSANGKLRIGQIRQGGALPQGDRKATRCKGVRNGGGAGAVGKARLVKTN